MSEVGVEQVEVQMHPVLLDQFRVNVVMVAIGEEGFGEVGLENSRGDVRDKKFKGIGKMGEPSLLCVAIHSPYSDL